MPSAGPFGLPTSGRPLLADFSYEKTGGNSDRRGSPRSSAYVLSTSIRLADVGHFVGFPK